MFDRYITDNDFREIASTGLKLNAVGIPFGYWIVRYIETRLSLFAAWLGKLDNGLDTCGGLRGLKLEL